MVVWIWSSVILIDFLLAMTRQPVFFRGLMFYPIYIYIYIYIYTAYMGLFIVSPGESTKLCWF